MIVYFYITMMFLHCLFSYWGVPLFFIGLYVLKCINLFLDGFWFSNSWKVFPLQDTKFTYALFYTFCCFKDFDPFGIYWVCWCHFIFFPKWLANIPHYSLIICLFFTDLIYSLHFMFRTTSAFCLDSIHLFL